RPVALRLRTVWRASGDGLEVRPRREVPALTPEHPSQPVWVRLEGAERLRQGLRPCTIHSVAHLRPAYDHSRHWPITLHTDCHTLLLLARTVWQALAEMRRVSHCIYIRRPTLLHLSVPTSRRARRAREPSEVK